VIGSFTARAAHDPGEPWGIDPDLMALITERVEDAWGTAAIDVRPVLPAISSPA
jgi:hypothetical protein